MRELILRLFQRMLARSAKLAQKPDAPLLYLSGPMTGMPELNFPAFHRAAAGLRRTGYRVINPAELDAADTRALTWAEYMRRDIKVLTDCEVIALLPGWQNSRGARIEKLIADALGMRVIFLTATAEPMSLGGAEPNATPAA